MVDVKMHVKDGRKVRFVKAYSGNLWYETELGFQFPVPVADMGNGTFLVEDKAMLFLKYIRRQAKHHEASSLAAA
jgi:hypothetical protein